MKRLAWYAGLAILAVIVFFAQLDRQARHDAWVSAGVPEPFRGFAQYRLLQTAIREESEDQLAVALDLIEKRPLPAEHLSLLALASTAAGDDERGLSALHEAGLRGWRDSLAQLAMGEGALQTGEYEVAADRAKALWATGDVEPARALLHKLTEEPRGRVALAKRLDGYPRVIAFVLQRLSENDDPALLDDFVRMAEEDGLAIPCDVLQRLSARRTETYLPADCLK